MRTKLLTSTLLIFPVVSLFAQDGHYWSENFGNKSSLLSGTVNASVNDLGAVFYNPGRLGLIENPAFVISAEAYEWRTLKIEDGIDEGINLNRDNWGGVPSLLAGTFKIPFLKNHRFAYSFLTRQRDNRNFFVRVEKEGEITDGIPGVEIFNGKFRYYNDFKDEWWGLTWNPPVSNNFSLGLSTFVSGYHKTSQITIDMNAINEDNHAGYYSRSRNFSFESFAVLWKLGLAYDLSSLMLGLTLTTPRIHANGKGSTLFEEYLVGVDTTGDGNNNDGYIFNIQDISNVQYKSPWAVGFGVGIPFNKGIVHLSGEWYSEIKEYTIMEIDPFIGQSTGDTIRFRVKDKLESVINFGIGGEYAFSKKVSAYASFAADFSAVPKNIDRFSELGEATNNSVFQADFYQFGGGFSIMAKKIELTLGATYRGASYDINQTVDFPPDEEDATATIIDRRWRFIFGFSFPFLDKIEEKADTDN